MTRDEEIKILSSLKGDTYFVEFFRDDIDKMCENIKNDYPIECGCQFTRKIEAAAQAYKEESKREQARVDKLLRNMAADGLLNDFDSRTYRNLLEMVGWKAIVWAKVDENIDLNLPEIQWLCGQVGIKMEDEK